MRGEEGVGLPAVEPPPVGRLRLPGRVMQEMVQRLPPGAGNDGRQFNEGLGVFARQQEADELLPHRLPFLIPTKQVVEVGADLITRFGDRLAWCAWGGHGAPPPRPSLGQNRFLPHPARFMPDRTNQRLNPIRVASRGGGMFAGVWHCCSELKMNIHKSVPQAAANTKVNVLLLGAADMTPRKRRARRVASLSEACSLCNHETA